MLVVARAANLFLAAVLLASCSAPGSAPSSPGGPMAGSTDVFTANPTAGTRVTIGSNSVLPGSVHRLAKIPADSLFVAGTDRISVFTNAAGGWAPTNEITSHVSGEPRSMAIDSEGYLFVANFADQSDVSIYRLFEDGNYVGGHTKGITFPTNLAVDAQDNLAVVTYAAPHPRIKGVRVYPFGVSDRSYELKDVSGPSYVLYDAVGSLYVANANNSTVGIYNPYADQPTQTISLGVSAPAALALDHRGVLYVANFNAFNVTAYRGPDYKLVLTIPTGALRPLSVASMGSHIYIAAVSQTHFKSVVLDYNTGTGQSTRIVDGISNPIQVMICSKTYLCVANSGGKVSIYQADKLVHTIDIKRDAWSMTTR
jgi:hypothetical protein